MPDIIQFTSDYVGFLIDGKIFFYGTIREALKELDKKEYTIRIESAPVICKILKKCFPDYYFESSNTHIEIFDYNDTGFEQFKLFKVLNELNIKADYIIKTQKKLSNVYREVMKRHDL